MLFTSQIQVEQKKNYAACVTKIRRREEKRKKTTPQLILIKTQKNDMYFCMRKLNKLYVLAKQNCTCPLLCIKSSTNGTNKTQKKKNCFRMMPSLTVLCRLHLCLKFNTQKHIAATKRIQCYKNALDGKRNAT